MERGDVVKYMGCSKEQIRWGNNDDPRSFLILGREYTVEKVEVHSQHTKVKLLHKMGWFNSVCFKLKHSGVNNNLEYLKDSEHDLQEIVRSTILKEYRYEHNHKNRS